MCGISGKINYDTGRQVDAEELKRMTDSLYHRGPDDEGFYINNNIGLGFRRLSIIDLSTGHQPLANEDDSIWIIFNGEIYNYQELQESLVKQGHVFRTKSDTETIVHLYEQYGVDCLKYLRGMFAFAIWDNNKKQLFCARDRFGIKPFYYYSDKEKFVFGSEIKAILRSGNIDKTITYDALNSYFAYGYITSDLSIYNSIKKLQPGHYLLLSPEKKSFEIKKYWSVDFEPDFSKTEKQWTEEIESCLSEVVRLHMISDVPLGAFLSGGIDSSSVVAMMAKNSSRPIETFTIGFKDDDNNELENAREIAKRYGCTHHEQIVEPESISLLPKLVKAYDEPFADSSAIPTYYVSKFAREYVTVALSGDGGDELFAGYGMYGYLNRIYKYNSPFPALNKLVWGNIHKLIPHKTLGKGLTYFLAQNKEYLGARLCIWSEEERKKLILDNKDFKKYKNVPESFKESILKQGSKNDFVSNLQYLDIQTFMVDSVLTKVDRASMLNSLEVRVPLLDHKFAELTFKIPSNLKLHNNTPKYIFKQAMKNTLPANILVNKKIGFNAPISLWFKEELKEYVNDTLLSNNSLLSNHLEKSEIKKVIADNESGSRDFSGRIWSLLFFEEWLKQNQSL